MSSKEILERLVDISRHHSLDEHDAFVCCILSHGGPGVVYGTDGVAVDMDEILSLFRPDNCDNLAGKPKLFFVQVTFECPRTVTGGLILKRTLT